MAARNAQLDKLAKLADKRTVRMVAMSNVISVANYCSEIYANDAKGTNRVQLKMNSTMRKVTGAGNRARISKMAADLDWLYFDEMVKFNRVMLCHKLLSTGAAPYTMMLVVEAMMNRKPQYNTRVVELRIAWNPRLERKGRASCIYKAVQLYNQTKVMGKLIDASEFRDTVKDIIKKWR